MRSVRLSRTCRRLTSFALEGRLGASQVFALWDGRVLTATDELMALADLAAQVDTALVERGMETERCSCSVSATADRALLTLVSLCDEIFSVEFTDRRGVRKVL